RAIPVTISPVSATTVERAPLSLSIWRRLRSSRPRESELASWTSTCGPRKCGSRASCTGAKAGGRDVETAGSTMRGSVLLAAAATRARTGEEHGPGRLLDALTAGPENAAARGPEVAQVSLAPVGCEIVQAAARLVDRLDAVAKAARR